jgi:CDP-diacylglycerol pyrophosphatase
VRFDVRARLAAQQGEIGQSWRSLAGGLNGHSYQIRRIEGAELAGVDPFKQLAAGVPGAASAMGRYTLAVVGTRFADGKDGFYLLAGKADLAAGNTGSAEDDVQDHDCSVAEPTS